jgi:hypothetical protein
MLQKIEKKYIFLNLGEGGNWLIKDNKFEYNLNFGLALSLHSLTQKV